MQRAIRVFLSCFCFLRLKQRCSERSPRDLLTGLTENEKFLFEMHLLHSVLQALCGVCQSLRGVGRAIELMTESRMVRFPVKEGIRWSQRKWMWWGCLECVVVGLDALMISAMSSSATAHAGTASERVWGLSGVCDLV